MCLRERETGRERGEGGRERERERLRCICIWAHYFVLDNLYGRGQEELLFLEMTDSQ